MTQRPLVLLDSIALVNATHAGSVIVSGSHGGLSASHFVTAQTHKPFAVAFNDAGGGKDDAGRVALRELQQAVRTGQWLQRQGIQKAMVLTSPWCRCKDTANLLGYGQPEVEPAIGSFFEASQEAADYTQRLQKRLAQLGPTKGDKALILVTHHVNIYEFVGENIASGDMVVAKVDSNGKRVAYTLVPRPN